MLDEATRTAILKLREQGHGSRMIARTLGAAGTTVRRVLSSGQAQVPPLSRVERVDPWREVILELHTRYEGHLGRVHDGLLERSAQLSYPTLTAFCRKHGIGSVPPLPAATSSPPEAAGRVNHRRPFGEDRRMAAKSDCGSASNGNWAVSPNMYQRQGGSIAGYRNPTALDPCVGGTALQG
jgi:hypothetical protein